MAEASADLAAAAAGVVPVPNEKAGVLIVDTSFFVSVAGVADCPNWNDGAACVELSAGLDTADELPPPKANEPDVVAGVVVDVASAGFDGAGVVPPKANKGLLEDAGAVPSSFFSSEVSEVNEKAAVVDPFPPVVSAVGIGNDAGAAPNENPGIDAPPPPSFILFFFSDSAPIVGGFAFKRNPPVVAPVTPGSSFFSSPPGVVEEEEVAAPPKANKDAGACALVVDDEAPPNVKPPPGVI